jgi:hypothetical protein
MIWHENHRIWLNNRMTLFAHCIMYCTLLSFKQLSSWCKISKLQIGWCIFCGYICNFITFGGCNCHISWLQVTFVMDNSDMFHNYIWHFLEVYVKTFMVSCYHQNYNIQVNDELINIICTNKIPRWKITKQ